MLCAAAWWRSTATGQSGEGRRLVHSASDAFPPTGGVPAHVCQAGMSCKLQDMPSDAISMVYPEGVTRCIFSTSTDFAFQVVKGDPKSLLIFFQGGGACWDEVSTDDVKPRPCLTDVSVQPLVGIFDRKDASNPFRNFTVLHVNSCSGDFHVGSVMRWYLDPQGQKVVQLGCLNALAAFDWADANIDSLLDSLVIAGSSTGAIAVHFWVHGLLRTFQSRRAAVLVDSFLGVLPKGSQGSLLKGLGACSTGLLSGVLDNLQAVCEAERLRIQDALSATIAAYPEVLFAAVNSQYDWLQIGFYKGLAQEVLQEATLPPETYLQESLTILNGYNQHPNFVAFLADGDEHGFLPFARGLRATGASGGETLGDWLARLLQAPGQRVATVCTGCGGLSKKVYSWPAMSVSPSLPPPAKAASSLANISEERHFYGPAQDAQLRPMWSWKAWAWYYALLAVVFVSLCVGAIAESRNAGKRTIGRTLSLSSMNSERDDEARYGGER